MIRTATIARVALLSLGMMALGTVPSLVLTGCEEAPPPPPPPPTPPPPPPPSPDPVDLAPLMRGIDARVQFPEAKAPYDASLAEAVIAFAAAFASGDDAALGGALDNTMRGILDSMIADDTWYESTEEIEAVRVVFMSQEPDVDEDANYGEFVLAIQEPGGAYTLGWSASETDGGWVMNSLETVDLTLPRAADWDGDSLGQYQSAMGWNAGGGVQDIGLSPADFGADLFEPEYAALVQREPIVVYLDVEGGKKLFPGIVGTMPNADEGIMRIISMRTNLDAARVKELYEEGKQAVENGRLPEASAIKEMVDSGLEEQESVELDLLPDELKPQGVPETKEEMFAFLAELLGKSASDIERLYNSAP